MKATIPYTLIFLGFISLGSLSHGFGHRNAFNARPRRVVNAGQKSRSSSELNVSADPLDPMVEAELCSTMAHVALDFTGLFSPSRSFMRLVAVIGRLFVITADYLPDHFINSEELIIQIFLLSLALRELLTERVTGNATSNEGRQAP